MMKRLIVLLLLSLLCISAVSCKNPPAEETPLTIQNVISYADYAKAENKARVAVEGYVQATEKLKEVNGEGKITVYLQDKDGAYLAYEMKCASSAEANRLVPGTKIRVSGIKNVWEGCARITNAYYEIVPNADTYIAPAYDVTALLASDSLSEHQNKRIALKGLTVEPIGKDKNGNDTAFYYKWDNAGNDGDDLYFKVTDGTASYTLIVSAALADENSAVYQAVKELRIGYKVDLEGFIYWNGKATVQITAVTAVTAA